MAVKAWLTHNVIGAGVLQGGVILAFAVAGDWAVRSNLRRWVAEYWDEALTVVSWAITGMLYFEVRKMRKEREEFFRRFLGALPAPIGGEVAAAAVNEKLEG